MGRWGVWGDEGDEGDEGVWGVWGKRINASPSSHTSHTSCLPNAPCPMPYALCPSKKFTTHCSSDRSGIAKLTKVIKIQAS
ncbi:MAG: hypothetical protein RMY29_012325 [Nostoc sp. CreGUA01]|nr:hypothetical protein [Nostoc sp. CreGUA01]